jgi:phage gpG-like protein
VVTQKVTMPARPYLGLSAENRAEASRSVVAYLRRMLG